MNGEKDLVLRVQRGDMEAYSSLMDLHVRRLRAYIALNTPVPHLVDEISHQAFVFAYRNIQDFKAGTSFMAWLKSIAWNLLRAEIQRFSREQANKAKYAERRVVGVVAEAARKDEGADRREASHLEACMENITPRMRGLLDMRYTHCLSTREIAEQTDHSSAWVRTTLFRLRRQLKECVEGRMARMENP